MLLGSVALHWWLPLHAGEAPDLQPAARQEPLPAVQATVEEGPVLVQIEFEVGAADAPAFVAAMDEVGHLRRRNGAIRWRLFQDVAEPTHWIETFVLGDWIEHQRLRAPDDHGRRRARGPCRRLPSRPRRRRCAATWSPAATTAASCSTRPSRPRSRRPARAARARPRVRTRRRRRAAFGDDLPAAEPVQRPRVDGGARSARRSRPRSIGPRYAGHFGHLTAQTASARSSSSGQARRACGRAGGRCARAGSGCRRPAAGRRRSGAVAGAGSLAASAANSCAGTGGR